MAKTKIHNSAGKHKLFNHPSNNTDNVHTLTSRNIHRSTWRQEDWLVKRRIDEIIIIVRLTDISIAAITRENAAQFVGHVMNEAFRFRVRLPLHTTVVAQWIWKSKRTLYIQVNPSVIPWQGGKPFNRNDAFILFCALCMQKIGNKL